MEEVPSCNLEKVPFDPESGTIAGDNPFRWLYFSHWTSESDIWMLTLNEERR